jgi:hypothetical protein
MQDEDKDMTRTKQFLANGNQRPFSANENQHKETQVKGNTRQGKATQGKPRKHKEKATHDKGEAT